MNGTEKLDRIAVLAAGALAGGIVKTPEEAAKFAFDCYDRIREEPRRRKEGKARVS